MAGVLQASPGTVEMLFEAGSAGASLLVSEECFGGFGSEGCAALDLGTEPDAEFQDVLEFFRGEVPAVLVADGVRREVVVEGVLAACAVGLDVVGVPCGSIDQATANVAAAAGFGEDLLAGVCAEPLTRGGRDLGAAALVEELEEGREFSA